ncbi:MAG: DUF4976 domain-containing protein [Armatimonadetes bacterium]|nr:DUF4976 domain-containing protein [Armatimonadota bacterium]
MPTALSLLGLDIPQRVLGRNVWSPTGEVPGAPDHVVTGFGDHASIRTHKWNYIQPWKQAREGTTGRYELYDLERDPQELTNVLDDNRKIGEELASRLEAHIKRFRPLVDGSFQSVADAHDGMSFDALPAL